MAIMSMPGTGSPHKKVQPYNKERLVARWVRRAITIPLVYLLTTLAWAALPGLLVPLLAVDLVTRRRFALCRAALFLCLVLAVESVSLLVVLAVWLINLPIRGARQQRFLRHNAWLQTRFCTTLYRLAEWTYGMRTVCPAAVPPPGAAPLLVLVRHASTADTLLPVVLLAAQGGHFLRYVLKRELLLDPCLDIVGNRLPNYFVRRGGDDSAAELRQLLALAADMGRGEALVIYPEGTRFTPTKRTRVLARLRERGPSRALQLAEELQHTLPPLQKGPLALLAENRGADLLIIGHTGLEVTGSLPALFGGGLIGQTVHVFLRHIPFAELPQDPDAQAELLAALWREVDQFIAQLHKQ